MIDPTPPRYAIFAFDPERPRRSALKLFLVGVGANGLNHLLATTSGFYSLSLIIVGSMAMLLGLAGLIFPQTLFAHHYGRASVWTHLVAFLVAGAAIGLGVFLWLRVYQ